MADPGDQQSRGPKRKAEELVNVETKRSMTDSSPGETTPPGETVQELRQQNAMLKQLNLKERQKCQELADQVEQKDKQLAEAAEEIFKKEQLLQSQEAEMAGLRARRGLSPPPPITVSALEDLQPHDQLSAGAESSLVIPISATDASENEADSA